MDPNGNTTASYGYTPYGQSDSQLSQGDPDKTSPINPFRYSAKRLDTGSGTLDMGVRRFGPVSHFLTPDFFYGSLANVSLSIDPLTDNRYNLAGGNPISFREWDGHMALADGYGGASTTPTAPPPARGDVCGGCPDPTMSRDTPTAGQTPSDRQQAGKACTVSVFGHQFQAPGCRPDKGCLDLLVRLAICQPEPASDEGGRDKASSASGKQCPVGLETPAGYVLAGLGICGPSESTSSDQSQNQLDYSKRPRIKVPDEGRDIFKEREGLGKKPAIGGVIAIILLAAAALIEQFSRPEGTMDAPEGEQVPILPTYTPRPSPSPSSTPCPGFHPPMEPSPC